MRLSVPMPPQSSNRGKLALKKGILIVKFGHLAYIPGSNPHAIT
jgi:hypothetical protein